ncbi:RICIN domain-containing protein, partial [Bifidobacterium callimiconis]|uniref:RICIN domain-containing protein n=1 Tax=Bifidobacterium callimiconis TaxID=2306973 RepID=UPI001BDD83C8
MGMWSRIVKAVVGGVAATAMLMPVGAAVAAPADGSSVVGGSTSASSTSGSTATVASAQTASSPAGSGTTSTVTDTSVDGPAKVEKTHVPQTAEESFVSASDASTYGLDAQSDEGDQSGDAQDDGAQPNGSNGSEEDSSKSDGLADGTKPNTLIAAADLNGLATVGVTWKQQDMTDTAKAPKLELRYFKDNAWSEWQTLPSVDDDLGKMGSSPAYYVGLATEAEARLTPVDGQTITEAKFITVDPGYSAEGTAKTSADTSANANTSVNNGDKSADSAAAVVSSSATESATTVDNAENSVDSNTASATAQLQTTEAASAASTSATTPSVRTAADAITSAGRIHTREEWWQSGNPARQWKPDNSGHWQGAVVHHTYQPANNYTQAEVPALINGIYVYHNTSNGWGDIGYNLLVDKYGGIWEGRDEGVDNQVVPASEAIGAHSRGFNSATFGVVVLGDFTTQAPSDAAINSVSAAIAWEFNALGITNAKDTFEYKGTQPRITGHGDKSHQSDSANNTACPGQKMWDRMDDIRNKVQKLLDPAGRDLESLGKKIVVEEGDYYILSAYSGKTLEIAEASKEDSAAVEIHDYSGSANQIFHVKQTANGKYLIAASHSGKVLDASGPSLKNGTRIIQYSSNGGENQQWEFYQNSQGYTFIKSVYAGDKNRVLDVTGAVNADGTPIELWNANGGKNQQFRLVKKGDYRPGANGWLTSEGKKYWYEDGVKATNQEVFDPNTGSWYWVGSDGQQASGWVDLSDGRHVYYDPSSCAMVYGERSIDGRQYYFDPVTGARFSGWRRVVTTADGSGDRWVYYGSDGAMLHGEGKVDGAWYYFDDSGSNGRVVYGWKDLGKKTVYYGFPDGRMRYGEQRIDDAWYYLDPVTGARVSGWQSLPGKTVYYDSAGKMVYGERSIDGRQYYFDPVTGARFSGWRRVVTTADGSGDRWVY